MKKIILATAALAALPLFTACNDDDSATEKEEPGQQVWVTGRVYDGATGARLTSYEIELQYFDRVARGSVDGNGRYVVGPLEPFHDYTVEIRANGYRSFLSHNEFLEGELAWNPLTGRYEEVPLQGSFYYDAYLFPASLVAPATTFHVTTENAGEAPAGTIRFTPVASSALIEDRAGVNNQVWGNAEDLQFRSLAKSFADGRADVSEGELVYGVEYMVNVLGVSGYQVAQATFAAGIDGDQTITLAPFSSRPLEVVYDSGVEGRPVASGEFVVVFNQPVELDPAATANHYAEQIDDAFGIASPDTDGDEVVNTFFLDESESAQEKGTSFAISGNVLTFSWNADAAFEIRDTDDVITAVFWNGLDAIVLRPVGGKALDSVSLATLLGTTSVTVPLVAAQ